MITRVFAIRNVATISLEVGETLLWSDIEIWALNRSVLLLLEGICIIYRFMAPPTKKT
jgi:hypothetical protein